MVLNTTNKSPVQCENEDLPSLNMMKMVWRFYTNSTHTKLTEKDCQILHINYPYTFSNKDLFKRYRTESMGTTILMKRRWMWTGRVKKLPSLRLPYTRRHRESEGGAVQWPCSAGTVRKEMKHMEKTWSNIQVMGKDRQMCKDKGEGHLAECMGMSE